MPARIESYAELLAATGDAPVVRFEVSPWEAPVAWRLGAAVCFVRLTQSGGRDLVGLGPVADLGPLLTGLVADGPGSPRAGGATSTSIEQRNRAALVRVDRSLDHGGWYLMSARRGDVHPVDGAAGPPEGLTLTWTDASDPSDAAELTGFLDEHHTSAWTRPGEMGGPDARGHPTPEQWAVLRDARAGRLVAVGCVGPTVAGVPRIAGVAVEPPRRGRGLGRYLTVLLTARGHADHEWVELGVDHDHPAARRLYTGLGYRLDHAWWSEAIAR